MDTLCLRVAWLQEITVRTELRKRFCNLVVPLVSIVAISAIAIEDLHSAVRPNILLILADDMGYGDLSCYGSLQIDTPHIDALAAEGVRCTQAYVTACVCAPSRAGLITGRYPNRFGFEHNLAYPKYINREWIALEQNETTIADCLKNVNYRTGIFGKWHLGESADWHLPNERGFDCFFGMLNGHHSYFPTPQKNHLWRQRKPVEEVRTPYLTDWITDEAIEFVNANNNDHPWFLYLSYNTPHNPLEAKPQDIALYSHIKDRKRRVYSAMQHALDENIGRLVNSLKERSQFDNTLVVFLSDNGGPCMANGSVNAPLRGQKGTLLEGGIRVPMIFRWPQHLPAGIEYHHPVSSLDLFPTFMAAANSDTVNHSGQTLELDGVDLQPFFSGHCKDSLPHKTLCWRWTPRGAAIRDGDWKLLRLPHMPPQLFDLSTDVSELRNLAAEYPDVTVALMAKLNNWELEFESQPRWMSAPHYNRYSREVYDEHYQLEQLE